MRILSRIDTVSRYDICPNLSRVLKCLSSLLRVLFGLPRAWSDELFRHQNKFELPPARVQALTSTKQLSCREKDKKYPAPRILSLPARSHQESDILYKTECGGSDFLLASNGSASCYSAAPGVFLLFAPVKLLRFVMASVLLARFCLSQSGEGCDRWWGWAGPSEQVLIIALLSSLSSAETDSQWRQQFLGGVDPQSSGIYNLNLYTNNLWSLHSQIASNNVDCWWNPRCLSSQPHGLHNHSFDLPHNAQRNQLPLLAYYSSVGFSTTLFGRVRDTCPAIANYSNINILYTFKKQSFVSEPVLKLK